METPANLMTPTIFAETVQTKMATVGNGVQVLVHDEAWAKEKGMGSFLSVTNGTKEPAKFLEITYKGEGSDDKCIALVGKGVTFDSGGISIKPSASMDQMRADMGGAANVAATICKAVARVAFGVYCFNLIYCYRRIGPVEGTSPRERIHPAVRKYAKWYGHQTRRCRICYERQKYLRGQHRCRRATNPGRRTMLRFNVRDSSLAH